MTDITHLSNILTTAENVTALGEPLYESVGTDPLAVGFLLAIMYGSLTLGSIVIRSPGSLLGSFLSTTFLALSVVNLVSMRLAVGVMITHGVLIAATATYQGAQ